MRKDLILHLSALSVLLLLELLGIFSDYHQGNFARILVLAAYGVGYNILFGYTGLLSLGHALFFSAGLYASGLSIYHLDYDIGQSIIPCYWYFSFYFFFNWVSSTKNHRRILYDSNVDVFSDCLFKYFIFW